MQTWLLALLFIAKEEEGQIFILVGAGGAGRLAKFKRGVNGRALRYVRNLGRVFSEAK